MKQKKQQQQQQNNSEAIVEAKQPRAMTMLQCYNANRNTCTCIMQLQKRNQHFIISMVNRKQAECTRRQVKPHFVNEDGLRHVGTEKKAAHGKKRKRNITLPETRRQR